MFDSSHTQQTIREVILAFLLLTAWKSFSYECCEKDGFKKKIRQYNLKLCRDVFLYYVLSHFCAVAEF